MSTTYLTPPTAVSPLEASNGPATASLLAAVRTHVLRPRVLLPTAAVLVLLVLAARALLDLNFPAVIQDLQRANPERFVIALAVFYLIFPLRALRWRVLLENVGFSRQRLPSLGRLMRLMVIASFANSVTVAQLGDVYRAYLLKREAGVSFPTTLGTILAERLVDVATLVAMACPAVLVAYGGRLPQVARDSLVVGLVVAVLGIACLRVLARLRGPILRLLPHRFHESYVRLESGTLASFRRIPQLVAFTSGAWLVEGATLYMLAHAVGAPISPAGGLVAGLVASLASTEPITPGGLGVTESGIVLVLASLGVDLETASAVAILNRIVNYLSLAVVGPVLAFGWRGGSSRQASTAEIAQSWS